MTKVQLAFGNENAHSSGSRLATTTWKPQLSPSIPMAQVEQDLSLETEKPILGCGITVDPMGERPEELHFSK